MRRYLLFVTLGLVVLATLVVPQGNGVADAPQPVIVTNLPEVQKVTGRVTVGEPIPQTRLETRKSLVSPAELSDTNHLTDAGVVDATGFTYVTVSLGGSLQGSSQGGSVGAVLIPDLPEVSTALRTFGVLQFPLRVQTAVVPAQAGLFSSDSTTFRLAFPRYRVLFYNSTTKSADATVYVYLSTS
jgi:hypothetical protein